MISYIAAPLLVIIILLWLLGRELKKLGIRLYAIEDKMNRNHGDMNFILEEQTQGLKSAQICVMEKLSQSLMDKVQAHFKQESQVNKIGFAEVLNMENNILASLKREMESLPVPRTEHFFGLLKNELINAFLHVKQRVDDVEKNLGSTFENNMLALISKLEIDFFEQAKDAGERYDRRIKTLVEAFSSLQHRVLRIEDNVLGRMNQEMKNIKIPATAKQNENIAKGLEDVLLQIQGLKIAIEQIVCKTQPLTITEATERQLIKTFIKINKLLVSPESEEVLPVVKAETKPVVEKAKVPEPEVIKPKVVLRKNLTPSTVTNSVLDNIVKLRNKGLSFRKIGEKLKLSYNTVYRKYMNEMQKS